MSSSAESPDSLFHSPQQSVHDEDAQQVSGDEADQPSSSGASPNDVSMASHEAGDARAAIGDATRDLRDLLTRHIESIKSATGGTVAITGTIDIRVEISDTESHTVCIRGGRHQDPASTFEVFARTGAAPTTTNAAEKINSSSNNVGSDSDVEELARPNKAAEDVGLTGTRTGHDDAKGHKRNREPNDADPLEQNHNADDLSAWAKRRRTDSSGVDAAPEVIDLEQELQKHAAAESVENKKDNLQLNSLDPKADERSQPTGLHAELKKISNQIRWVEDCRRIADEAHDSREEKWRTTSATFHDAARKDREIHEKWMVAEITRHGNMLQHLLNEVKTISNQQWGMKWETPAHLNPVPPPQVPVPIPPRPVGRPRGRPPKTSTPNPNRITDLGYTVVSRPHP